MRGKRRPMKRKASKKYFKKTQKIHKGNFVRPTRGGIRL